MKEAAPYLKFTEATVSFMKGHTEIMKTLRATIYAAKRVDDLMALFPELAEIEARLLKDQAPANPLVVFDASKVSLLVDNMKARKVKPLPSVPSALAA